MSVPGTGGGRRPHRAKGRVRPDGYDSKLEADFALQLELRRRAGEFRWVHHEPFGLRLGKATFYHPDFVAQRADDDTLVVFEVKGRWEEDAIVKWKVAIALFPWLRFVLVKRDGNRLVEEEWS